MNRPVAAVVSIGLIAATLEPILRAPDDDGFPLSTFPMFAAPRPTEVAMSYAQGAARDGRLRALSPDVLGTGEVLQAFAVIQRAVDADAIGLCTAIAARVAADPDYRDVVAVRIVTATHDAVDYVAHGAVGSERTRARCDVVRSPP